MAEGRLDEVVERKAKPLRERCGWKMGPAE